jgi:hypothetical protein
MICSTFYSECSEGGDMGIIEGIVMWVAVLALFCKFVGKFLESADRRAEAQAHERLQQAAKC